MKRFLIYTGLVILLFVIGFVTSRGGIEFSISLLDLNGTNLVVTSLTSQYKERIFFSIAIGTIPLILFTVNKINGNLSGSRNKYLIPLGIIILAGIISWMLRIFVINRNIKRLNLFDFGEDSQQILSFNILNFSIYLLIGFIIGGIICIPVMKGQLTKKKRK